MNKGEKNEILFKLYLCYLKKNNICDSPFGKIKKLGFDNIDTVVGISINGISFAHEVARNLDCEFTVFRTTDSGDGSGSLSSKYGQVSGKKVVIIDDVLSTGKTVSKTISAIKEAGGDVGLVIVLVNKTMRNEIGDIPLRGVIRAVSV